MNDNNLPVLVEVSENDTIETLRLKIEAKRTELEVEKQKTVQTESNNQAKVALGALGVIGLLAVLMSAKPRKKKWYEF